VTASEKNTFVHFTGRWVGGTGAIAAGARKPTRRLQRASTGGVTNTAAGSLHAPPVVSVGATSQARLLPRRLILNSLRSLVLQLQDVSAARSVVPEHFSYRGEQQRCSPFSQHEPVSDAVW
jgi:hypothetical protein